MFNQEKPTVKLGVCNRDGCVRDEPDELVTRRFKGTNFRGEYCAEHDPLEDPNVADLWEEP